MTKPFELVAGHPALDLVNTLDWRFRDSGTEELIPAYSELLRFTEESGILVPKQAKEIRRAVSTHVAQKSLLSLHDLRESLAAIFYALVDDRTPPQDAIKKLNHYLGIAQTNRRLRLTSSGLQLTWLSQGDPDLPLWLLTQSATELLTSEAIHSIRDCADPSCRWLFLDTSKNHSRRWCDMKICGNRMKARRFKAQHNS